MNPVEPKAYGSREEHLVWAKQRALEYLPNVTVACASFFSDMNKHEELRNHSALPIMQAMLFAGLMTESECRKMIEDFA